MKTKVNFFSYYISLYFMPISHNRRGLIFLGSVLLIFSIAFSVFGIDAYETGYMVAIIALISPLVVLYNRSAKPNISSLLPMTHKRKAVYELLSIPFTFVLMTVALYIFFVVAGLLLGVCFMYSFVEGITAPTLYFFEHFCTYNIYSTLTVIFTGFYLMGASTLFVQINNKNYANTIYALLLCYLIAVFVITPLVSVGYTHGGIFMIKNSLKYIYIFPYIPKIKIYLPILSILPIIIPSIITWFIAICLFIKNNIIKNY